MWSDINSLPVKLDLIKFKIYMFAIKSIRICFFIYLFICYNIAANRQSNPLSYNNSPISYAHLMFLDSVVCVQNN